MNKKKIVFLTFAGVPSKNCGGGNRIVYELMNGLSNFDCDLIHINSNGEINYSFDQIVEFNPTQKLKKFLSLFLIMIFNNYLFSRIKIQIKKQKLRKAFSCLNEVSVINAHDSIMLALIDQENIPKVLSIHHKHSLVYDLKNNASGIYYSKNYLNYMRLLEMESIRKADLIVFASESSFNNYQNEFQELLQKKKTVIIYNGVAVNMILKMDVAEVNTKYNIDSGKYDLRLINLANHIKPKNIDVLIRTVEVLKKQYHKNPLLVNVGTGPLTSDYQKLIKQMRLENNIRLLGQLKNEEVIALLKWAKYFVMASEKVVFDIVVIEALAAGCCVIVTNNGGNREIIKDKYNGYLVNKIDPQSFAEKIIVSEDLLLKNAGETVIQFDLSKTLAKYKNIFSLYLNDNPGKLVDE
jgi:glycosyltransferase involved in cell wall biosynthesis